MIKAHSYISFLSFCPLFQHRNIKAHSYSFSLFLSLSLSVCPLSQHLNIKTHNYSFTACIVQPSHLVRPVKQIWEEAAV